MDKTERRKFEAELAALRDAGESDAIIHRAIDGYGGEICHFLMGMLHNEAAVEDAFQEFCIEMVQGLPSFEWRCSFRVWAYHLARGVGCKVLRDPDRRRGQRLNTFDVANLHARRARTVTAEWRRTAVRDKLWVACQSLPEIEQNLVALRVRQRMSWVDIALVLSEDDARDDAAIKKRAAALRKRFERVKLKLRESLVEDAPEK